MVGVGFSFYFPREEGYKLAAKNKISCSVGSHYIAVWLPGQAVAGGNGRGDAVVPREGGC